MAPPTVKQWRFERTACNREARVIGSGMDARACTVVDTSLTGMRIRLQDDRPLPTSFVLAFDGRHHDCEIVWRKGRDLGVRVRGLR